MFWPDGFTGEFYQTFKDKLNTYWSLSNSSKNLNRMECKNANTSNKTNITQISEAERDTMPGVPELHHLLEFAQTHAHWVKDAIQPSHPLLPPSPPALSLSQHQGLFQWVSSSHHVAKYWSFSFSISPSNEYSGMIPFWMDWFDLLTVQGTLKSLLQHHSLRASILQCLVFFMAQLSHLHMTPQKTIALTIQSLSAKWCLCF